MSSKHAHLAALARYEALRLWREPRLRWVALLAPVLILIIFAATMNGASRLAEERRAFDAAERARWLAQGYKDPHSAAHYGVWAVKPASPLAALMPGVEPFVGLAVWLEAHKRNEMIFRPRQDADPVMRSATSVAQLLSLLGPLFAILLGFAGFARERESGTLRMALGNGATRSGLVLRCAFMFVVLACMMVVPAALLGAYALYFLPGAGWDGASRLALWCALHLLYLLIFLLLSVGSALRAPNARSALAALLAVWLLLSVVLPRAASDAAAWLSPTPSYQAVRHAAEQEAPAYESAQKWESRVQFTVDAQGKQIILNRRAARLDQSERDSHAVFDRLLGRFYDALEAQDRCFGLLGAFTPAVALDAAGASVAGTDFYHHRQFIEAAETYRRSMVNRLNGELMKHSEHADAGAATGRSFWESTAALTYRPPSLANACRNVLMPLVFMLAWLAAAAALAWRSIQGVTP